MNPQVKYFEELKNNHQNLTPRETVHSGLSDPQESFVTPESYPPRGVKTYFLQHLRTAQDFKTLRVRFFKF